MAENDWSQLLSDVSVLESESEDEDAFAEDEEDDEDDDSEFDPITLGAASLAARGFNRIIGNRKPARRARPTRSYTSAVRGRGAGVVQTPNGPARIALPGNFPTVEEFRKTVGEIQKDMKANSAGIKELGDQQKKDVVRLAELIATNEKKTRKQMKRTQTIAIIGIVLPLAMNLGAKFIKAP